MSKRQRQQLAGTVPISTTQCGGLDRSSVPAVQGRRSNKKVRMASRDSRKSTRISLACIACRAKKHRCSGEKPRCAQCTSTDVVCEWPAQQKRGPPKQYIHSLEKRLVETERLLLSLLCQTSDAQLQAAFRRMPSSESDYNTSEQELKPEANTRQEASRPSYWNSFPLDSEENVRRWCADQMSRTNLQSLSTSAEEGYWAEDVPNLDYCEGALPLPTIAEPTRPNKFQNTESYAQPSSSVIGAVRLQSSWPEMEVTSGDVAGVSTLQEHSPPITQTRVEEGTNRPPDTRIGKEQGDGKLSFSSQFKNDFLW